MRTVKNTMLNSPIREFIRLIVNYTVGYKKPIKFTVCLSEKTVKSNCYEDKSSCCVNYGNRCVTLADELPKIRVQN